MNTQKSEKRKTQQAQLETLDITSEPEDDTCNGVRMFEVKEFRKHLRCCQCHEVLCFDNVIAKERFGLTSVFNVKREKCLIITKVPTGKFHKTAKNSIHSGITSQMILGAVHAEIGFATLNKLLFCTDIPTISSTLYKRYEREVGTIIEETAVESCKNAAKDERKLAVSKMEELCKELPEELRNEISFY